MYQTRVRLLGLAGVCVSLYALHVELKMEEAKQLEMAACAREACSGDVVHRAACRATPACAHEAGGQAHPHQLSPSTARK